jgi:hypothetical protein
VLGDRRRTLALLPQLESDLSRALEIDDHNVATWAAPVTRAEEEGLAQRALKSMILGIHAAPPRDLVECSFSVDRTASPSQPPPGEFSTVPCWHATARKR